VNPATPDGINRAIARAGEAQVQWAKTSFRQRRRVLRTLLKYEATGNFYYLPTGSSVYRVRLRLREIED